jgi:hypothetical protein
MTMTEEKKKDYEVGYGKPPRHSQFVPGQSGFKGRKKRKHETKAQMIARVRDEMLTVNGQTMTKFELAVRSVIAHTIKGGKPRELKVLFDMLAEHGAMPEAEDAQRMKAAADEVMAKLIEVFERENDIDPADSQAVDELNRGEARLVMDCPHCGPKLRANWKSDEYRARLDRYGGSHIHQNLLRSR